MFKFVDDTYLVVSASNTCSRRDEIAHIKRWAENNNLTLNTSNSKELVLCGRGLRDKSEQLQPTCTDIERVTSHTVLGVVDKGRLTADDHVNSLLSSAASLLYAPRILRSHGTPT